MGSNDATRGARPEGRAHENGQTVGVLNARLLLYTILIAVVLVPAIYAWHAYQVRRTARAFLERADQLESAQDWVSAAIYLHRYLSLHPEDNATRIRMTSSLDRGATDWRQKAQAVNVYYQTLGLIPETDQPALRCRLAELLLELRRYPAAEVEAEKLLAADAADPQGRRLLALALYGEVQSGAVVARSKSGPPLNQVFESALQSNPGDVRISTILAEVYRSDDRFLDEKIRSQPRDKREALANRLMDEMVQANPKNADACLARHRYRILYHLPGADQDLQAALKYGPDNVEVLLVAAESVRQGDKAKVDPAALATARAHVEHVLQVAPTDERAYLLLGDLMWSANDRSQAVTAWRQGLEKANKDSLLLHQRLAQALVVMGQTAAADTELSAVDEILALRGAFLPASGRTALESFRDLFRGKMVAAKKRHHQSAAIVETSCCPSQVAGRDRREH